MAPQKMTKDVFATNLKSGKYTAAGGARKALAKAHLTATDKHELAVAIDRHFGLSSAPPGVKAKAKSLAPAAKGKPGRKPGRPAGSGKTGGARASTMVPPPHAAKNYAEVHPGEMYRLPNTLVGASIEAQIQSVSAATEALKTASVLNPNFQVDEAAGLAGRILTHLLGDIHRNLGLASDEAEAPTLTSVPPAEDTDEAARILGSNGLRAAI